MSEGPDNTEAPCSCIGHAWGLKLLQYHIFTIKLHNGSGARSSHFRASRSVCAWGPFLGV